MGLSYNRFAREANVHCGPEPYIDGANMTIALTPACQQRLLNEQIIWLTTVTPAGQPLPTPVWFLWTDSHVLMYSEPAARKMRNLQANPRAALHFNGAEPGSSVLILTGEAVLDPNGTSAAEQQAYIDKYATGLATIGYTPEQFVAQFSATIRMRPRRLRTIE